MEVKKNPNKDIHQKSGMFFQIGLGISVAIVITAFEWTTEVSQKPNRVRQGDDIELTLIPPTVFDEPAPPSPVKTDIPIVKTKSIQIIEASPLEITTAQQPTVQAETAPAAAATIEVDDPEVCPDCLVVFPEQQAEPQGGYAAFYARMRDNMKYPRQARNFGAEGRVFVEFVVNRDGSPTDMHVVRGIGYGCDEEAMRVVGMSRWNPGKQRGRPVRVKMVLPIVFKLQ